tara:strand:+ start:314 stop:634 length:321 start_codon:yes stop_codon:yes gene_type:complete
MNNEHDLLTVYHTNLRNIGLFITISMAIGGFKFKSEFMKKYGTNILVISFLLISLLLNIELFYIIYSSDYESLIDKRTINIIPYLTLLLIIILIIRLIYKLSKKFN